MPVLSGFLPIPLAMMIPFMGAQSLVLGKQFGEGFQYGKRKISAMSNEEFNKVTPAKLAQDNARELREMIPSMKASITDMRDFQSFIVHELIETAKQLPNDIFQGVTGATGDLSTQNIFKEVVKSTTGGFIPEAFAEESPKKVQKFADDYEREADRLPFKLLSDIVQKMLSGKLLKPIERKIGYVNSYKKRIPAKSTTTVTQAIASTTVKGSVIQQIATKFNEVKLMINTYHKKPTNENLKKMLNLIKVYNRFVQSNRHPGLTINTANILRGGKPVQYRL